MSWCALSWLSPVRGQQTSEVLSSDDEIVDSIEREQARIVRDIALVRPQVLAKQLERKSCRLELPPAAGSNTAGSLYERSCPSVVVVAALFRCDDCEELHASCASGFLLTTQGHCVTNYHVVAQPDVEHLVVRTNDGRLFGIREVLAASREDDIAIVALEVKESDRFTPLRLGATAGVGDDVWVLGHPDHHFYVLTRGIVSRYHWEVIEEQPANWMDITADFGSGSSGSPVLSSSGAVIGVVCFTNTVYVEVERGGEEPPGTLLGEDPLLEPQMTLKSCVPVANLRRLLEDASPR